MKDILEPSASRSAPIAEKSVRVRVEPPAVRSEVVRKEVVRNEAAQNGAPPNAVEPGAPASSAAAPAPADGADGFASNRKLIRPSLARSERASSSDRSAGERSLTVSVSDRPLSQSKKPQPPEQTYAEPFYFQKQMQSRTPMVVVLTDGEELRGIVEWYDKDCIKLNRSGPHPNLLVYKAHIKYVFKDEGKR